MTATLTIRTAPPATPSAPMLSPADDSGMKGDGVTNVTRPHLIGTADPNVVMQMLDRFGYVVNTTTTAADGTYTFAIANPLGDGPAPFRVRELDAAGTSASPALRPTW